MVFSIATKVFIVSTLGVPISYSLNRLFEIMQFNDSPLILISIVITLLLITILILYLTRVFLPTQKRYERFDFYLFSLFAFISVVSLITGLELDGLISGFMNTFLKYGEPHLRSSHGVMICYWNGTGMYAMYLMMIAAITWETDFYDVSLYWFGSIENSVIVLLLAIVTGKSGVNLGSLLYIPYLFLPPIIIFKMYKYRVRNASSLFDSFNHKSIVNRPKDILLIFYLLFSIGIALIRGIAVMTSNELSIPFRYIQNVEPYLSLKDPAPFGKSQMIIYLFYFIPIYIISIYALLRPWSSEWMPYLSLVHGGASIQAQLTHIVSSFHSRTPYIKRVPQETNVQIIFWVINLTLLIGPQLLAFRCRNTEEFSSKDNTVNGMPKIRRSISKSE